MYQKLYKPWTKGNFWARRSSSEFENCLFGLFWGSKPTLFSMANVGMFPLPVKDPFFKKNPGDDWLKQRWGSIPQLSENNIFLFPTTLTSQRREKTRENFPGESLGWKWWVNRKFESLAEPSGLQTYEFFFSLMGLSRPNMQTLPFWACP